MVGKKPRLGISIYPDFYNQDEIKARVDVASENGYQEIFTSIQLGNLGFENTKSGITEEFKFLFDYAKERNLTCHVDLNAEVLASVGASIKDLKQIADLNIPIIRLDGGFNNYEIAELTNNEYGIIIEENLSNYSDLLKRLEVVKSQGNIKNYYACHNFFPHNDTGLDLNEAVYAANLYQAAGCQTGIFISSLASKNDLNAVGFGVPSIERHRYLPSHIQLLDILATKSFDYIIFGDSDPSYEELVKTAQANQIVSEVITQKQKDLMTEYYLDDYLDYPCLDIPVYFENLSEDEIKLIESLVLISRTDKAEKLIRATQTRHLFSVTPHLPLKREKYNIFIDNDLANRYSGEIHILLDDFPAVVYANYIGMIKPYATDLVNHLHSGKVAFRLRSRKD